MKKSPKKQKKKMKINKDICINILCAIIIVIYFFSIKLINAKFSSDIFNGYIKISYIIFLILSILVIEISYKKDNSKLGLYGVELLIISIDILLLQRIVEVLKIQINSYIFMSVFLSITYYIIKCILIDTIEKRNELKKLSDIKDIVKKEKPVKKVAKKRKI